MIILHDYPNESKTKHNSKWLYIPDHQYSILIIAGLGSGKINALLNLKTSQTLIKYICMLKIHMKQNNKTISLNILFIPRNTKKNKTCIQIKT